MAEVMYGPMQLIVVGFDNPDFHGQIRRALDSVMEKGIIRLIDARFVYKDADGNVAGLQATQLSDEERERFGAVIGGLLGLGAGGREGARAGFEAGGEAANQRVFGMTEESIKEAAEEIPPNNAAALFLIEHVWAKELKQALRDAGGFMIADGIVTPEALVAVGAELQEATQAAEQAEAAPSTATAR